jgi:hypothetical protein
MKRLLFLLIIALPGLTLFGMDRSKLEELLTTYKREVAKQTSLAQQAENLGPEGQKIANTIRERIANVEKHIADINKQLSALQD